ncbi:MAG: helix-turn-helix transcriptional regulator [Bacteroidetes bacterium]|nr:helix-turn-helix transcriptional regulator [Bacteroidota bacterium]
MNNNLNNLNKPLSISDRIRTIREFRGFKQISVANDMQISQQAYSFLERKAGNVKMDTLKKFCNVMKVDLPFLLATDIPVTKENMETFDRLNYSSVFNDFKLLKAKAEAYESLLQKKNAIDNLTM